MCVKIAINGFGRIGRVVLRIAQDNLHEGAEIVAINARADVETLAHLFTYDSCYGTFKGKVETQGNSLIINGKEIKVFNEKEAKNLPWKQLGIDVVIESTGIYTKREQAMQHIEAGAKKVVITAPAKNEDITIVMGVNDEKYNPQKHHIISNASCTTNCLAPFTKVLNEQFGIVNGCMTTIHSYTNDQKILDKTHKDLRRARAAGESIIPTTTGAAKALAKVIPSLEGKINGSSLRVPTAAVSITELICEMSREVTVQQVNSAFQYASQHELKGILGYSEKPLVSIDYKGDDRSSIVDGLSTMVIGKNILKVLAWYDNEWGYSSRTVDLVNLVASKISNTKNMKMVI
ncbi:type I glyceraldehyde-3-phosphate dehydrogenase [Clostridium tagluense]|uniref:type I glyceraldehyde-3-phosphate dehydrogenase n=1 Tax=Clostridium TaxID=1485 RepID=UPI0013E95717|nr:MULTISPECIES: type I glyceraldehyde-3-phosphate dehydrogenase [Clostridium]MBU3127251.1 type I glyceraldehyde-3-phosphate dehydrogenase [Clostridium tagluense]MBW9155454.1 type I glyceraldehyde-3-phosphate dehydrogenase [Clostridium tagluense]MBZ9621764.1 type I glyceraldehyde-3-phosphate dehydrogenase [Clostridium sp. FP2]MCB2298921.1 type I glyceraldehyde-3-phosphate dehydrogenase [Clostridium tagluense]MCB2312275.1 type I glyceraldehyde-3-phosphate dehydrogenase [Clostridium tagluense]